MTETITGGPGPRHVFAPHPDPVEGMLHRIYIIFEESDGRLWASGTDNQTLRETKRDNQIRLCGFDESRERRRFDRPDT